MHAAPDLSRTAPQAPSRDLWDAAMEDFNRGLLVAQSYTTRHGTVRIKTTLTFRRAWSTEALTEIEKQTLASACIQVGRGIFHPMLWLTEVPHSFGATMASPYPGITITWRPHWLEDQPPVLLTLDVHR